MKNAIVEVVSGVKSLLVGMRITIAQFFKPAITVHYPHQTLKMPARFRGHIQLVRDERTGLPKCFVCKLCQKACPSDCITVEGVKPEGAKRKVVNHYILDFTKCSLCGSCVEACRDGAIRFSREYNLAGLRKEDFIMDLFQRLQQENERKPVPAPEGPAVSPTVPVPRRTPAARATEPDSIPAAAASAPLPSMAVAAVTVEVK